MPIIVFYELTKNCKEQVNKMRYQEVRKQKDQPKLNLNKARLTELILLPGIGKVTGERIIEYRQHYGPFRHVDDLVFKVGLRQSLVDRLSDRLQV